MTQVSSFSNPSSQKPAAVVDLHGDILLDVLERREIQGESKVLVTRHLPDLRAGGVKVQVLPIFIESRFHPDASLRRALLTVDALYRDVDESEGSFRLIRSAQDLEFVPASDAIGLVLAFEGAEPLGRDVGLVRMFYEFGLRMLGLTWNRSNSVAQGAGEDAGGGLSTLGRTLLREMAALGIILDVSHLNEQSFWQALEYSSGHIVASHSNASAVCPHPRNLADAQIKAIAERNGLIGLTFVPRFIGESDAVVGLAAHAAHMAELVGAEHLAIGGDFTNYLKGVREPSQLRLVSGENPPSPPPSVRLFPEFREALLKKGFSTTETAMIMGGNAMRFLAATLPR